MSATIFRKPISKARFNRRRGGCRDTRSTFSTAFMSFNGRITATGSKPSATLIAPAVSVSRFAKSLKPNQGGQLAADLVEDFGGNRGSGVTDRARQCVDAAHMAGQDFPGDG